MFPCSKLEVVFFEFVRCSFHFLHLCIVHESNLEIFVYWTIFGRFLDLEIAEGINRVFTNHWSKIVNKIFPNCSMNCFTLSKTEYIY